jgi:cytochrome b
MKVLMFTVRIWDLPTRLFHWVLASCVVGLVITGNIGGDAMVWHFRFGYAVLTLLLFRLIWGFTGGHWSRWAQLPLHPRKVRAYLTGHADPTHLAGHNPLGSWSVVALLFFLGLQVSTGLFSDDEIANMGPLSPLVSGALVSLATSWHKGWGKLILLVLVCIHLLAIAWYRWRKRESLVPAMWHGDKVLPVSARTSRDNLKSRGSALLVLILSALTVTALLSLGN